MKLKSNVLLSLVLSGCFYIPKDDLDGRDFGDGTDEPAPDDDPVLDTGEGSDDADDGDADDGGFMDPNTSPLILDLSISPDTPIVSDTLTAEANTFDAEDDEVTLSYVWYINDEEVEGATSDTLENEGLFSKGDTVRVVAIPTDGTTNGDPEDAETTINNSAPSSPITSIDERGSTCHSLVFDGDGDAVAVSPSDEFVGATEEITVEAWINWSGDTGADWYPIASQGWGEADTSRFFFAIAGEGSGCIGTSSGQLNFEFYAGGDQHCLPSNIPISPGNWQHVAATFKAGNAKIFIDGAEQGSLGGASSELDSVETDDLLIGYKESGDYSFNGHIGTVHYSASALYDEDFTPAWPLSAGESTTALFRLDEGEGDTVSDSTEAAHEGEIDGASWDHFKCFEGDGLVCVVDEAAVDLDGDDVTYAVTWTVDGEEYEGPFETTVFDMDTIPTADLAYGEVWTCSMTASDGVDSSEATENTAAVPENRIPEVLGMTLSPNPLYTDDTLRALVTARDIDGDDVGITYTWHVNDETMSDILDDALDGTYFVKGNSIYVVATPYDLDGEGEAFLSEVITVSNTAPMAPNVSLDRDAGSGDLQCTIDEESTDVDDDEISYTFAWDVDGEPFEGSTASSIHAGDTIPSELLEDGVWTCSVTPNDGEVDGTTTASDSYSYVTCDNDGDGYESLECGGEDCNDSDASVHPQAGDTYGDETDSDCDGLNCDAEDIDGVYYAACSLGGEDDGVERQLMNDLCIDAGYDGLVSIFDSVENEIVKALRPTGHGYAIGLYDDPASGLIWESGAGPVEFTDLVSEEADADAGPYGVMIGRDSGHVDWRNHWYLGSATTLVRGLICEARQPEAPVYQLFTDTERTWSDADDACRDEGHDGLAMVLSESDQEMLAAISSATTGQPWIGMLLEDGEWIWRNGTPISDGPTYWYVLEDGESGTYGSEGAVGPGDRGIVLTPDYPDGAWWSASESELHTYICESRDTEDDGDSPTDEDCTIGTIGDVTYAACEGDLQWEEADDYCRDAGYDGLASIWSDEENDKLLELFGVLDVYTIGTFWIGLNDRAEEGEYVWSDGSPMVYTKWDGPEPDDDTRETDEDCIVMITEAGTWGDTECVSSWGGGRDFACEIRDECEGEDCDDTD